MKNFELGKYITIGQYLPTESPIHQMDPRWKIVSFVVFLIGVSAVPTLSGQVLLLVGTLAFFYVARIPFRYGLSGIRPLLPFLCLMFILEILLYQPTVTSVSVSGLGLSSNTQLFRLGFLNITTGGVYIAILSLLRFFEIVWVLSVFTLSTTLSDLTRAMESLLRPLSTIRVPVHQLIMVLTIALRFVPTFALEAEKLMKAQAARGADFGTSRWWQIVRRTRSALPIIIPLFLIALRRGEDLVLAMEARGYVPGGRRSSYVSYTASLRDGLYVLLVILVVLIAWVLPEF